MKKRRRWPWVLLALVVIIGIAGAVAKKPKDSDTSGSTSASSPALPLTVGRSDTTSGIQVTLMGSTDPWTSTNQFENPAPGNRYVAVELTMVNTTNEVRTFSTLLGLELVDSLGQHWTPAFAGVDLPSLDGDLAAAETRRGSQIFEVPVASTGLLLTVKGSLTASGLTFTL